MRLGRIASAVVAQLQQRAAGRERRRQKVEQLAAVMDELGYDAHTTKDVGGAPAIEADNCIFHELAMKDPEICQFDLALLSASPAARSNSTSAWRARATFAVFVSGRATRREAKRRPAVGRGVLAKGDCVLRDGQGALAISGQSPGLLL